MEEIRFIMAVVTTIREVGEELVIDMNPVKKTNETRIQSKP